MLPGYRSDTVCAFILFSELFAVNALCDSCTCHDHKRGARLFSYFDVRGARLFSYFDILSLNYLGHNASYMCIYYNSNIHC